MQSIASYWGEDAYAKKKLACIDPIPLQVAVYYAYGCPGIDYRCTYLTIFPHGSQSAAPG